jgi:hypothetical protein
MYGFRSSPEEETQVVSLILENVTGHLSSNEATVKNNGTVCWHVLVWSVECADQMVLNRTAAFFPPPSKSKVLLDLLHCLL